jgi:methylmalonyl-CoA mutase C-terminal domain/subunit
MPERPIRVLIAKPGLDGHDRGAKVVVKAVRNAGMEVIYTGRHQAVDAIVEATIQEDVEVLGLSVLSGAHLEYCTRIADRLRERGAREDLLLLVGGTISASSVPELRRLGFDVFPTGSRLADIVAHIRARVAERRSGGAG